MAHLVNNFTYTIVYAAGLNIKSITVDQQHSQCLNDLIDMSKIKKIQKDDYNIFIITSIDKKTKVKPKIDNLVNWHRHLDHLNAEDIIKLSRDP